MTDAYSITHLLLVLESFSAELLEEERNEDVCLVRSFPDVFSRSEFDLGRMLLMTHHIDTGDVKPMRQGLRRDPQVYIDVIEVEISKMKTAGVIEAACSPWASNVVIGPNTTARHASP